MVTLNPELMRRAREAARALQREGVVRATYLFGSHVEGRAHEWSDIDVAAFIEGAETWDIWRRAKVVARVQKEVGYDIEPHVFAASLFTNPRAGSFAEYILEHGIPVTEDDANASP
jgi:predicted nucleotidyltransferase